MTQSSKDVKRDQNNISNVFYIYCNSTIVRGKISIFKGICDIFFMPIVETIGQGMKINRVPWYKSVVKRQSSTNGSFYDAAYLDSGYMLNKQFIFQLCI